MRLRVFAGPNGSGKSTLKSVLKPKWLGIYINPDDLEAQIKKSHIIKLVDFDVESKKKEIEEFFLTHPLTQKAKIENRVSKIIFLDNKIDFFQIELNSYFSSILSDFIRRKLILSKKSMSFETVMSSYDKVEFLKYAKKSGYRTYLYFIATDDPKINISRVENRVKMGGHFVPEDKIVKRYYKSLDNLFEAVKISNRSFIFDNSGDKRIFLAEINEGKVEIKVDKVPFWFEKYFIKKAK